MGHGFFVPLIAAYIVWQRREELAAIVPEPNWWGLLVVALGGLQLVLGTLGAELFTTRMSFVITLIGVVWTLGGNVMLRKLAFPLFLLFFMLPIPAVIYSSATFKLQILASQLADGALTVLNIPVLREGNVLELPNQRLSVVDACSGIRSLLSLTFLSLVYGYFFERKTWVRVVLFFSTIPIAIVANASRVTMTGVITQVKPELAEGFFHEAEGWVIFMVALVILIVWHQILVRGSNFVAARRSR
jgi:exosortase